MKYEYVWEEAQMVGEGERMPEWREDLGRRVVREGLIRLHCDLVLVVEIVFASN